MNILYVVGIAIVFVTAAFGLGLHVGLTKGREIGRADMLLEWPKREYETFQRGFQRGVQEGPRPNSYVQETARPTVAEGAVRWPSRG